MKNKLLIGLGLLTFVSACATDGHRPPPPPPPSGEEASIHFLNHGGVYNWAADGNSAVYLQDDFRHWYHARLMGPCTELPWAEAIGVETRGNDTLDRFGAIIVRGQRCQIHSLVKSGPPPKKFRKHKADKDHPPR